MQDGCYPFGGTTKEFQFPKERSFYCFVPKKKNFKKKKKRPQTYPFGIVSLHMLLLLSK